MAAEKIDTDDGTVFYDEGYAVHKLGLTQQTIEKLKEKAQKTKTAAIFNQQVAPNATQEALDNDKKRKMSKKPFSKSKIQKISCLKELWKKLEIIAKYHNRDWQPFKLVVLRSEAGCMEQETHTDGTYGKPDIGGILIAVEDKTFFDINGKKLELHAGYAVAFHGNTPHNGAAYEKENVRYHVYLARDKHDVPEDEVGKFDITCDKCATGFETINQRKNHTCHSNPEEAERKKERATMRKRKERANKKKRKAAM
jgi:hypothetical protein